MCVWTRSRTQVQLSYNLLKEGQEGINDDARSGRLSTSTSDENIEAVKNMILANRRTTIREVDVDVDVGILFGSCQAIFKDVLAIKRVTGKLLNFKQKECLSGSGGRFRYTKKIITGDKL